MMTRPNVGRIRPLLFDERIHRWLLLAGILVGAVLLRLWGIKHGLPFVYSDEKGHFVPKAISFFRNGYNPEYFINPPAFSYLLHGVYWLRYGGAQQALEAFGNNPADVYLTGRIVSALLGTATVWLVYLTAKRLFDARVGLVSAALMAVAYLPTFYSHRALNDVPTLVPVTLSLFGSAGILLRGKKIDYAIAGVGLGLAVATKYLGGIVLIPLVLAAVLRVKQGDQRPRVLLAFGLGAFAAAAAFFVANPFALLDYRAFLAELEFASPRRFVRSNVKLGLRIDHGLVYYLWTVTWGLGWAAAIATAGGAVLLSIKKRAIALLLVLAPVLYILFMGARRGYFGRYLLPIFPFLVILAGHAVVELLHAVRVRFPHMLAQAGTVAIVVVVLLGPPLAHSIHANIVLTKPSTRDVARTWVFRNIPSGSYVWMEPIYLDLSEQPTSRGPGLPRSTRRSWRFVSLERLLYWGGVITRDQFDEPGLNSVKRFVTWLRPHLVDALFRHGICWVITGSGQFGRAFNDPEKVPQAIAYYRELARRGRVALHLTPFDPRRPLPFDLDASYNFYPLGVTRPGPEIIVYQLPAARCRTLQPPVQR